MADERRYSEEDAAAIFQRAAEAQQGRRPQLPANEGMTLVELTEIGREVGIPAELVAEAARSIDHTGRPVSRTSSACRSGSAGPSSWTGGFPIRSGSNW